MKKLLSIFMLFGVLAFLSPGNVEAKGADCVLTAPINMSASATIINGQISEKIHICAVGFVTSAAVSVSFVEGTGTACATNLSAIAGGTTASMSFAANGVFTMTAAEPFLVTKTTGDNFCILQTGSGNVSGFITYRFENIP
jgi:hypothetical protein